MDCSCEPKFPLSEEAQKLSRTLKILCVVYLIFAVTRVIVLRDFSTFIGDLITSMLILFSAFCANFFLASITVIFLSFNILNTLLFLGLRVQNKTLNIKDPYKREDLFIFIICYTLSLIIFLIICIAYSFSAYREFKYLDSEYNKSGVYQPVSMNDNSQPSMFRATNRQGTSTATSTIEPVNRQPAPATSSSNFQGRGYTWGNA